MSKKGEPVYLNGKAPKVPPTLRAWIVAQSNAGKQSDEIAEAILTEHGIQFSPRSVRGIIQRARMEQADAAKSVVRAELRSHLIPAIQRIERVGLKAGKLCTLWLTLAAKLRANNEHDPQALTFEGRALKAMDRQLKSAIALLHYAGLDQPDDLNKLAVPAAERRAALLKRLEELTRPQLPPATNGAQTH